MTLALALRHHGMTSRIHEARPRTAVRRDARILALSHGTQQVLERLGVWPLIVRDGATPIRKVHVSHRHGLGRTVIDAGELNLPALGYVLPAAALIDALDAAVSTAGIAYLDGTAVAAADMSIADDGVRLTGPNYSGGGTAVGADECRVRLVAWAEGAVDPKAAQTRDYGQHAVLCTVGVATRHDNVAWERFTDEGPLALLPFGNDYAVVLTCASAQVEKIRTLDDDAFRSLLAARFGHRHDFTALTPRLAYPLGLRWRTNVVGPRQVWLGNAAQTLHPVAGQGFNLAVRDVWELARSLAGAGDPGAPAVLSGYAARRRVDRRGTMGFTDLLIDAFGVDFTPLKHLRGAGLLALDIVPPLRRFVARRMMFGANGLP